MEQAFSHYEYATMPKYFNPYFYPYSALVSNSQLPIQNTHSQSVPISLIPPLQSPYNPPIQIPYESTTTHLPYYQNDHTRLAYQPFNQDTSLSQFLSKPDDKFVNLKRENSGENIETRVDNDNHKRSNKFKIPVRRSRSMSPIKNYYYF